MAEPKGPAKDAEDIPQSGTEAALIQRLKAGDETSLISILRAYGPMIEALLVKTMPSIAPHVEDIWGMALNRLWSSRHIYNPEKGSLKSWLYTICRNCAIDYLKKLSHSQIHETELTFDPSYLRMDDEESGVHSKLLSALLDVLNSLSEGDRQIVLAQADSEGEGRWAADLGKALGQPASTIRSKRKRIFARIRQTLKERGFAVD